MRQGWRVLAVVHCVAVLDGSFAPAKKGGENVGLARKGKGTKWMLVVDGNGLPLGFHLDGAHRVEVRLAEQTLNTIRLARPRGRPKQRPETLVADRGYDSSLLRRVLRGHGIRMCIPPKRRPMNWKAKRGRPVDACKDDYRLRFKVERSFAWLGNFQRRLIRWERLFSVYRSGFAFAVILLCCCVCAERLPSRARSRWGQFGVSRARAVYEAGSVQPGWSTNGSGLHQRMC